MATLNEQSNKWFKEYWSKTSIEELNENIMKGHDYKFGKDQTNYEYNMKDIIDS